MILKSKLEHQETIKADLNLKEDLPLMLGKAGQWPWLQRDLLWRIVHLQKYGRVGLTFKDPNNADIANTMVKAGKRISNRVKEPLDSSVLVNKASAKKNDMYLQFTEGGVPPRIYFDVAVHEDLKT